MGKRRAGKLEKGKKEQVNKKGRKSRKVGG